MFMIKTRRKKKDGAGPVIIRRILRKMVKKEKQSFWITTIMIISIIILSFWLILFVIGNTIHFFDRDLCKVSSGHKAFLVIPCLYFQSFDEKTDYCNSEEGLQDSEKCKCEETGWKDKYDNSRSEQLNKICELGIEIINDDCELYNPLNYRNKNWSIQEFDTLRFMYKSCNTKKEFVKIQYDDICQTTCLKARPKNPCELGDNNFVEEDKFEFHNQTIRFEDNGSITYHRNRKEWTICREKTEVEKLKDKSCDEIYRKYDARGCHPAAKVIGEKCQNYKQSWKEKECEI